MIRELVTTNRSYRRFYQDVPVDRGTLEGLVDLARLTASGANLQPLKYMLSWEPERNEEIFRTLKWTGALKDWDGPVEGERPTGYILILLDTRISRSAGCDHGIAAQTILLGAVEQGLGGCMIGSVKRNALQQALNIPDSFDILLVIALGKPRETVRIDAVDSEGTTTYWRDGDGVHHVPKRSLDELIIG